MYHNLANPLFDINSFLFVWISYYFLKITFQIQFLVWKISPLKFLTYVVKISQSKILLIMSENSHSSVPMLIVLVNRKVHFFLSKGYSVSILIPSSPGILLPYLPKDGTAVTCFHFSHSFEKPIFWVELGFWRWTWVSRIIKTGILLPTLCAF